VTSPTGKRAWVAGSLGGLLALVVVTTAVVSPDREIGSGAAVSAIPSGAAPRVTAPRTNPVKAKPVQAEPAEKPRTKSTSRPVAATMTRTSSKAVARATKPAQDDRWAMVPMPQLPAYNHADVKNSHGSTRSIGVCRDWSTSSCRDDSPRGTLAPGESSRAKYGWPDTDGYRVQKGWVKQSGCFSCTVTLTVRR